MRFGFLSCACCLQCYAFTRCEKRAIRDELEPKKRRGMPYDIVGYVLLNDDDDDDNEDDGLVAEGRKEQL